MQASCAGGGTGTGDAVTRLLITPRLVRQVSGAVARQLGVRAYPTIMWLQLMDEGVTIAEHAGGRDAASLVAFAKAAPGMIEEGVAAQKAKEGKAEGGAAEGGAAEGGAAEGGAAARAGSDHGSDLFLVDRVLLEQLELIAREGAGQSGVRRIKIDPR